jgi:purine-nucleoside phosphorylase
VTASAKVDRILNYADIPDLPVSTVQSHHGRLMAGEMAGTAVLIFQGRFHLYEGYSPLAVTFFPFASFRHWACAP